MINVVKRNGTIEPLNIDKITKELFSACEDLNVSLIKNLNPKLIITIKTTISITICSFFVKETIANLLH